MTISLSTVKNIFAVVQSVIEEIEALESQGDTPTSSTPTTSVTDSSASSTSDDTAT